MEPELLTRAGALALASPLIVPLVEVLKGLGMSVRFAPLAALVLGLLASVAADLAVPGHAPNLAITLIVGLATGLSAAGLYSGARALAHR